MEKTKATKKEPWTYAYWIATWREGEKTECPTRDLCKDGCRGGSTKARAMKAKALGLTQIYFDAFIS